MLIYILGCSNPSHFVVLTSKDNLESTTSFVEHLDSEYFRVEENAKQREYCRNGQILLLESLERSQCYRMTSNDKCAVIEGDQLGLQYGLGSLLEEMGFGFYHPYQSLHPESELLLPEIESVSVTVLFENT